MNRDKLEYFKKRLIMEKERALDLLQEMEENEAINSNSGMETELSFYDNHPADGASPLYDKERGMAFKANEINIVNKIEDALKSVEDGSYGRCHSCGCEILESRLEFIPYTNYCVKCQEQLANLKPREIHDRPVEESVLGYPFGSGNNDSSYNDEVEFDAEDSYQCVESFNKLKNIEEFYDEDYEDGYVEPIEKISNEQYINSLPD